MKNSKRKLIIYSAIIIVLCFAIGIPVGKMLFDIVYAR